MIDPEEEVCKKFVKRKEEEDWKKDNRRTSFGEEF
jgi:hypothetical protein